MNYLNLEHTVARVGGSDLETQFCDIKFLHLVAGKCDFEHKTHIEQALIDAVSRKTAKKKRYLSTPNCLVGEKGADDVEWDKLEVAALRCAFLTGFHFCIKDGRN